MKKTKSTEKVIKDIYTNKMQIITSSDLDERVLANSMSKLEKVKNKKSANSLLVICRIIVKRKVGQMAAVIILILAISLFIINDQGKLEERRFKDSIAITTKPETPAELVSSITLTKAFQDGGMRAMEQQFDKAEKKVKPLLKTHLTVDQLICELDGC